jgi:hypothetical protein
MYFAREPEHRKFEDISSCGRVFVAPQLCKEGWIPRKDQCEVFLRKNMKVINARSRQNMDDLFVMSRYVIGLEQLVMSREQFTHEGRLHQSYSLNPSTCSQCIHF